MAKHYQGSPVTPIPEGFVPYNETTDEVVDDLESTQVDTATVRDTGGGGRGTINIPQPEKVDWSTYSDEELQDAYDKNRKTRMALTAMGAINPIIALFGQGATRMQEKDILEAMHKEKDDYWRKGKGGFGKHAGNYDKIRQEMYDVLGMTALQIQSLESLEESFKEKINTTDGLFTSGSNL